MSNTKHEKAPSGKIEEYTLEELKEIYKNLPPMSEEDLKNTFIEDDDLEIDFSKLKV